MSSAFVMSIARSTAVVVRSVDLVTTGEVGSGSWKAVEVNVRVAVEEEREWKGEENSGM